MVPVIEIAVVVCWTSGGVLKWIIDLEIIKNRRRTLKFDEQASKNSTGSPAFASSASIQIPVGYLESTSRLYPVRMSSNYLDL